MLKGLHWLGHSAFRFEGSKTIYFDPWKLAKDSKMADMILISHEHFDHFSKNDIILISSKDTVILTTQAVAKELKARPVSCKEIRGMSPGDVCEIPGIKIEAVASYNVNKHFHPKDSKKLGFIVSVDGVSIYHAGDTDNIAEMKTYRCDVALLPVSGTYVMTSDEAVQAALTIKPKLAIPMHYGDIVGSVKDAKVFQDLLKDKVEVDILKKES